MVEERRHLWIWGSVLLLIAILWGRGLVNLHAQSLTVDEPVHLVRGLAYWEAGDLRLQYGHPPLPHALIGSLAVLEPGVRSPAEVEGWAEGQRLDVARHVVHEAPNEAVGRLTFLGRWSVLALGLVLAALSYRWAADLFGSGAGLFALFLSTFDPNILSHASLATTDLPVTGMILAASYGFFRWLRRPTSGRSLVAGLTLGLAWGAKLSSLVLLPALGLAILWQAWRERRRLAPLLLGFLGILGCSTLVLWAIYRFETGTLGGCWVPMPTHWDNLQLLWLHQSAGHAAYFLGELSYEGWWYYFPVLFLIKTPLPVLLLLGAALLVAVREPDVSLPALAVLFPALYMAASIVSNINIGYRHILPMVPFLAVIASALWSRRPSRSRRMAVVIVGLTVWLAASSLAVHPSYLTYFNEIVGGPQRGYLYAVDSNFDWGQDLKRLGRYATAHDVDDLRLSYFGNDRPARYLADFEPLPTLPFELEAPTFHPFNPDPGTYAISASHLQGLSLFDPDVFNWFRQQEPLAKVGSIFVYRVKPDRPAPTWVAPCHGPAPILNERKLLIGLGRDDVRQVHVDCRTCWVYPTGGASGWYVVAGLREGTTFAEQFLLQEQIVFQGRTARGRPALRVYRWNAASTPLRPPADLTDRGAAATFGDALTFLGSERTVEDDPDTPPVEVSLTTYWRVVGQPEVPLSIMAHMTDGDGTVLGVADGLGFPVENWKVGDVFAQHHAFTLPPDAPPGPYVPRIGLYALGSTGHLPLVDGSGDVLPLAPLDLPGSSG